MGEKILERTTNLVQLYLHVCGKDEIPTAYYIWTCLAMIAACVSDRVYFFRRKEEPIYPNLYSVLIGESGSGKGIAFKRMESFIRDIPIVNYKRIRVTAQHVLDMLGRSTIDPQTGTKVAANPRLFLSMPEVSAYMHKGEHAETFIQMMTELYGGEYFGDGTRMHGEITVPQACINWALGSTASWLLKAMTPETVLSGLFARFITVYPEQEKCRDGKTLRIWDEIEYPVDYIEVVEHIKARVLALTTLRAEMFMTEGANAYIRQWMQNKPEPTDEFLRPWWRREREMAAKLAMIFCLADWQGPWINRQHVATAIKMLKTVETNLPDLIDFSQHAPSTEKELRVKGIIKKRGKVTHTDLARSVSRNVNSKELREAIHGLKEKRLILEERTPKGGRVYTWHETASCQLGN